MNPNEMENGELVNAFAKRVVLVYDRSLAQIERSVKLTAAYDEYQRLRVEIVQRMGKGGRT